MDMPSVKLLTNPGKSWTSVISSRLDRFLTAKGYAVVDQKSKADFTVCIGGDGTILYHNYLGNLSGAVVGVGSDRSVITQIHRKNWRDVLDLIENGIKVSLPRLKFQFEKKTYYAINDVVLHSSSFRVVGFKLTLDDTVFSFRSDGVVLATPMGSTAYSYSAGGPILDLLDRSFVATAIAPYMREFVYSLFKKKARISTSERVKLVVDGIVIGDVSRLSVGVGKPWVYLVNK